MFQRELLENHTLLKWSGLALVTTFLITALGWMNRIFATTSLSLTEWVLCLATGSLVLWVLEAMKFFRRRARYPFADRPTAPTSAPIPTTGAM